MKAKSHLPFRRLRTQTFHLTCLEIVAMHVAFLGFCIDNSGIKRIKDTIESVASANIRPVGIQNSFLRRSHAWYDPIEIILETTRNPVRRAHIESDAIEFSRRKLVEKIPQFPSVEALVHSTISSEDNPFWIARINRKCVTIRVYALKKIFLKCFTAVI